MDTERLTEKNDEFWLLWGIFKEYIKKTLLWQFGNFDFPQAVCSAYLWGFSKECYIAHIVELFLH